LVVDAAHANYQESSVFPVSVKRGVHMRRLNWECTDGGAYCTYPKSHDLSKPIRCEL